MERPTDSRVADGWNTCIRFARPFREVRTLPAELRLPGWFVAVLTASMAAGLITGWMSGAASPLLRFANGAFHASLYGYIVVSFLDAWEHFRLEHHVTGRWIGWTVVPFGESLLHAAIVGTLVATLELARPITSAVALRDWFVLGAPLLFLALGWADELIYHRRRALHREDILHTISHLAAGSMLVSLFVAHVVDWRLL